MEIVIQDGSRTQIEPGQTREIGRGQGLNSSDKTISRRHLSLSIPPLTDKSKETRLQFEVLGRNPIYVSKGDEVKIFRRFERGEMGDGDMLCVSAKDPVWYTLREAESCVESVRENDLAGNFEIDSGFRGVEDLGKEGVDIPDLNPVKEFGFVVMGHEFDSYPMKMIKDFKNWDWFLEEGTNGKDSEDEDRKVKWSGKRKREKGEDNDEEEWTGESEDDKELINIPNKAQKPSYTTRSKDRGKLNKDTSKNKGVTRKGKSRDDDEEEDEDDETLGGFIVDDEGLGEEEIEDEVDDDEEEEIGDEFDEDE